jgi:dihydrodipicolinate synthase/N-acetylneuraminate lyase
MSIILKGVMQSTVTPLKEDFSLDTPTFERLLDFHVRTGATAISWPHHKGESLNLTMAERKHFAEVAVKGAAGLKGAMKVMGRDCGEPRRPLLVLDASAHEKIAAAFAALPFMKDEPQGW